MFIIFRLLNYIFNFKSNLVPYNSVIVDASLSDFKYAISKCLFGNDNINNNLQILKSLWTSPLNENPVLPCLSVRSALDLFLNCAAYPPNSEIIVSAINIPSISDLLTKFGLRIVVLDIVLETLAPNVDLLESLITNKTRAILLACIYSRGYDLSPFILIANKYKIDVIEDWAEGFSCFDYIGHHNSALALFSFGPIKYCTAFGGCVAKIKDNNLYEKMKDMQQTYPEQKRRVYLAKILKYYLVSLALNQTSITTFIRKTCFHLSIDHKKYAIAMLRSFPNTELSHLRLRPSPALLSTMAYRMQNYSKDEIKLANRKAEYVLQRLPVGADAVGPNAEIRNHWLMPVLVDQPDEMIIVLNKLGIDAYRGTTQLSLVKPYQIDINNIIDETNLYDQNNITENMEYQLNRFKCKKIYNDINWREELVYNNCDNLLNNDLYLIHKIDNNSIINKNNNSFILSKTNEDKRNFVSRRESVKKIDTLLKGPIVAENFMKRVIYLPVNKFVPYEELDRIVSKLKIAIDIVKNDKIGPGAPLILSKL